MDPTASHKFTRESRAIIFIHYNGGKKRTKNKSMSFDSHSPPNLLSFFLIFFVFGIKLHIQNHHFWKSWKWTTDAHRFQPHKKTSPENASIMEDMMLLRSPLFPPSFMLVLNPEGLNPLFDPPNTPLGEVVTKGEPPFVVVTGVSDVALEKWTNSWSRTQVTYHVREWNTDPYSDIIHYWHK